MKYIPMIIHFIVIQIHFMMIMIIIIKNILKKTQLYTKGQIPLLKI